MTSIKDFLASHSITTHSIAAVGVAVVGAFYQVPQFHALVLNAYGHFPAGVKEVVVTAIALVTFYYKGANPQETPSK